MGSSTGPSNRSGSGSTRDRSPPDIGSCANCDREFELGADYRVTTTREDGDVRFYGFCDGRCRAEWERRNRTARREKSVGDP